MTRKQGAVTILVFLTVSAGFSTHVLSRSPSDTLPYRVIDTGQTRCFSDRAQLFRPPKSGEPFFGQDAFYQGPQFAYRDNGDGTISDRNTGLMWVKARGDKLSWRAAQDGASTCRVGGHTDWRMPTIKELYSLINFNGGFHMTAEASVPYLDTKHFGFAFGDPSREERLIDCQDWSATVYVGTTMGGNPTAMGVNFADGRIKGYPIIRPYSRGEQHRLYVRYVRGNPDYGKNDFHDNADGTITDRATGLMWSKSDSNKGMNWQAALAWVQSHNARNDLGHSDWRLPNAKELQSIVDYNRAPDATDPAKRGPAIDPIFEITRLRNGEYPYYWTGTTHLDGPPDRQGSTAVYVTFGRALGWMSFPPGSQRYRLLDVHGAGAQRSDPKSGDPSDYPHGRGPQGDDIRINNFVRMVRNVDPSEVRLVQPDLTPLPSASFSHAGPPDAQDPRRMRPPARRRPPQPPW